MNKEIVTILGMQFEKIVDNGHTSFRKIMQNRQDGLLRKPTKKEMSKHFKLIKKQRRLNGRTKGRSEISRYQTEMDNH